jgi:hypothetical protein
VQCVVPVCKIASNIDPLRHAREVTDLFGENATLPESQFIQ